MGLEKYGGVRPTYPWTDPQVILRCHLDWEALPFSRQKTISKSPQNSPVLTDSCLNQLGRWDFPELQRNWFRHLGGLWSKLLKSLGGRIVSLRLKRAGPAPLPLSPHLGFLSSQCDHIYSPFTSPFTQIAPTSVLPALSWCLIDNHQFCLKDWGEEPAKGKIGDILILFESRDLNHIMWARVSS